MSCRRLPVAGTSLSETACRQMVGVLGQAPQSLSACNAQAGGSAAAKRHRRAVLRGSLAAAMPGLLLGLWMAFAGGCGEDDNRSDVTGGLPWLTEITHEVGLRFSYVNGGRKACLRATHRQAALPSQSLSACNAQAGGSAVDRKLSPEVMGSGVALFDFDGDGDLDIYLTNGHGAFPQVQRVEAPSSNVMLASSTDPPILTRNRLYQQQPDGRFVDVTAVSGLGDTGYGMGVAIGDMDNDGDADVFVTNLGPDRLYRNRGDGTFEDVTASALVDVDRWSASACFFDYDSDGFLDLYVTGYLKWNPDKKCFSPDGRSAFCGPLSFPPIHDLLFHNNGDGTFRDVSQDAGIASAEAPGLGLVCEDLNEDGYPDVYVANDAYANHFWINQRDGTFRDEAFEMGLAYNGNGGAEASMGVAPGDYDLDGDIDLFLTHLTGETNTLYYDLSRETGFSDVTNRVGLAASGLTYTGFGTAAIDIELDGDLDLLVVNGGVRRGISRPGTSMQPPWDTLAEPNLCYLNDGRGRFHLLKAPVSSFCRPIEISRGLAIGDIDRDGDLDWVVTNILAPTRIYRNDAPRKGSWLSVRAVDPRLHRDAIGARITLYAGDRRFVRTIRRTMSYLSSSDPHAHFGLGTVKRIDRIEVVWPDKRRESFPPPPVNRFVELAEGNGVKR